MPDESKETNEKTSTVKVKFWLHGEPEAKDRYMGEITIEKGLFMVRGQTDDDTRFLNNNLGNIWELQRGVPLFEKEGDRFKELPNGRYVVKGHANLKDNTPDEVIEAIYDYTRAMGAFRVAIEPV